MSAYERLRPVAEAGRYERTLERVADLMDTLDNAQTGAMSHSDLETFLTDELRQLGRAAYQDHLDLRALRETRAAAPPVGADKVARTRMERGHDRGLTTVFGSVTATRTAYRAPGARNLCPADAALNLPAGLYSHGLRRLLCLEAVRGSYDDATEAVTRATGVTIGKRQALELVRAATVDVDAFYAQRHQAPDQQVPVDRPAGEQPGPAVEPGAAPPADTHDNPLMILQFDGKGIVMRPEGLRPATAKAAAEGRRDGRLPSGEKAARRRMAEIAAVYTITPVPRTLDDVLPRPGNNRPAKKDKPPKPAGRWLSASVVDDIPAVVAAGFDEAERRDPEHLLTWVVLVDGNNAQLTAIHAEAARRHITIHVVVDLIHVLQYIWLAAGSFFEPGDPDARAWVHSRARAVLNGHARRVASGIRRRATRNYFNDTERKGADTAAAYLDAKAPYLDYPTALAGGWPIATGVIEGACRHLIVDRFEIGGARWGLDGAEALLALRAVVTNDDFDEYWKFHLDQERVRNHHSKFSGGRTPT
jgi:hypothetical protein